MERRKGYVLVYSVIAMMLSCALVLSTVTIVFYYGNNIKRTVGENGARYVADSGLEALEDYLNAYYIDKGNLKTLTKDLWTTAYDIIEEIVPVTGDGQDSRALLALQGYLNYNYIISAADKTKALSADDELSGAYKVYIAESQKYRIRTDGYITVLCIGEYVYQNRSYYKFITADVVIEPVFSSSMITGLKLRTVDYSETIKGGNDLWGNVRW